MDAVKFVPPGGHRACLSCSAAKAKCVFPDDDNSLDGSRGSGVAGSASGNSSGPDSAFDRPEMYAAPPVDGVPAFPRCERCSRLDRDCLLPVRPRKKRRVGPPRPGSHRAAPAGSKAIGATVAVTTTTRAAAAAAAAAEPAAAAPRPSTCIAEATYAIVVPPYAGVEVAAGPSRRPTPTRSPQLPSQPQPQGYTAWKSPSPAVSCPLPSGSGPNGMMAVVKACFRMDEAEAERLLHFYRSAYADFHPVFRLTPALGATAAELQATRPALWLAIVYTTSYHDFEYQHRLARGIVYYFGEQLFQHSSRRLDLLQGVLLFLNMFTTQNYLIPLCTTLLHMAISLVTDLGLDRLEFSRTADRSPLDAYASVTFHGAGQRAPERGLTAEEQWALVVCYCTTNALGGITMMTSMQYTMQLELTCRVLEKDTTPSTEASGAAAILAISVRLYYLIWRVLGVRQEAEIRDGQYSLPVPALIGQYRAELDQLLAATTADVRSNVHVRLLYHSAEMHIYKIGMASQDAMSGSDTPGVGDSRIRCFMAVAAFFDVFFTLPVSVYYQLPITTFAQLVHADVTLAMLVAFYRGNTRPPGVPPDVTLPGFDDIMEALASRFQRARTVLHPLGLEMRNNAYDAFAARFRSFKLMGLRGRKKDKDKGALGATQTDDSQRGSPADADSPTVQPEETSDGATGGIPPADSEQAEWWAWFSDFRTTLVGEAPGVASGAASGAASSTGGSMTGGSSTTQWRYGPSSVGSIGSLLNNNDQEPDYYAYMKDREQREKSEGQRDQRDGPRP